MKINTKNKKGFTLVEIIIYIAIFSMISLLIVNSLVVVMSSFSKIKINNTLLESNINSIGRISREIRKASSIDLINSDLNAGILVLNTIDNFDNPTTVKFINENNRLDFYQNGVLSGNLLGSNINLDTLIFRRINTIQSEAIKIEMIIHNTNSKINKTESFYDTIILRGGYK